MGDVMNIFHLPLPSLQLKINPYREATYWIERKKSGLPGGFERFP
jgi:hypothetical protein